MNGVRLNCVCAKYTHNTHTDTHTHACQLQMLFLFPTFAYPKAGVVKLRVLDGAESSPLRSLPTTTTLYCRQHKGSQVAAKCHHVGDLRGCAGIWVGIGDIDGSSSRSSGSR
jgi:hypothetical protein